MNSPTNIKYHPNLVLIAVLSGGLTIVTSLLYILLSVTLIVFRFNCNLLSTPTGAGLFWRAIFWIYIQGDTCAEPVPFSKDTALQPVFLTHDTTVLTLVALVLTFSVISLAAAITLVTIVQDEKQSRYLGWAVYAYVLSCFGTLVVDITTASHFGVDHSNMVSTMRLFPPSFEGLYLLEIIRQGSLWLMVISMKGFVYPAINCIFHILLVYYLTRHHNSLNNEQHPIHKVGVLNAFDSKKPEERWAHPDVYSTSPFSRGAQINNAFVDDSPPHTPVRRLEPPRSDYYSNRSDSWHRPQSSTPQNARVFSYLEPASPQTPQPSSPAIDQPSSWRRDPWPQAQSPPVPAPDYSPTQPRRLKSAMKPGYM